MSYKIEKKGGKKIVKGTYLPKEYTCKCKQCEYTIEVPDCATIDQIEWIVKQIEKR